MTPVEEIRGRLISAARAFSWLGSIGVAKRDVEWLCDRVDELEDYVKQLQDDHGCAAHLHIKLKVRDRAPSSVAPADGARPRTKGYQGPPIDPTRPPEVSATPRRPFVAPPPQPGGTQRIDKGPADWRRRRPW